MKHKGFDCVQMKWDIQQRLLEEETRLGRVEARRLQDERVRSNPILGPFLQRLEARERKQVSETAGQIAGESRSSPASER
jgi:hypothetical protein